MAITITGITPNHGPAWAGISGSYTTLSVAGSGFLDIVNADFEFNSDILVDDLFVVTSMSPVQTIVSDTELLIGYPTGYAGKTPIITFRSYDANWNLLETIDVLSPVTYSFDTIGPFTNLLINGQSISNLSGTIPPNSTFSIDCASVVDLLSVFKFRFWPKEYITDQQGTYPVADVNNLAINNGTITGTITDGLFIDSNYSGAVTLQLRIEPAESAPLYSEFIISGSVADPLRITDISPVLAYKNKNTPFTLTGKGFLDNTVCFLDDVASPIDINIVDQNTITFNAAIPHNGWIYTELTYKLIDKPAGSVIYQSGASDGSVLYGITYSPLKLYLSTDLGVTDQELTNFPNPNSLTKLYTASFNNPIFTNPNGQFVSAIIYNSDYHFDSECYCSNDFGATWELMPEPYAIQASSDDASVLYAWTIHEGTRRALYKSTDYTGTWAATGTIPFLSTNEDIYAVSCSSSGEIIYIVSNNWDAIPAHRIYRSVDYGDTWSLVSTFPYSDLSYGSSFGNVFVCDIGDRVYILVYGSGQIKKIYRTIDSADTWDICYQKGVTTVFSHMISKDGLRLLVHEDNGILNMSWDGGDGWKQKWADSIPAFIYGTISNTGFTIVYTIAAGTLARSFKYSPRYFDFESTQFEVITYKSRRKSIIIS